MKSKIIFSLLLSICFVLSSCSINNSKEIETHNSQSITTSKEQNNNETLESEDTSNTQKETNTEETSSVEEMSSEKETSSVEEISSEEETTTQTGETPVLTIQSFKEYNALISSNVVSDKFVTYEDLSMFGNFYFLVFSSDAKGQVDYSIYQYAFNGVRGLSMAIFENAEDYTEQIEQITDVNVSDLRTLEVNTKGVYKCNVNGFEYRYINGKLSSVMWTNDGIVYILKSEKCALSEYDILKNDTVSKLLTSRFDGLSEIAIFKDAVADK